MPDDPIFAGMYSDGRKVASDEIGGVDYLIMKLAHGAADSATLVSTGSGLPVNVVAGGAGDGAIQDGANAAIEASVLDYTNSNPLAVRLTDTNGDYIAAGGGTQYTEDAAAAADPVGNAMILVRRDTPSATEVSLDGDNIAAKASSTGAQYVELLSGTAKIGGDATNGLDVDVTRSALPTGAATAAKQPALGTAGTASADVITVQGIASMTALAVSAASLPLPTGAATSAEQATQTASLSVMDDWDNTASDGASVSGDTPHDTADAGEPVKVGGKAYSPDGTTPGTAVAENDRSHFKTDLDGIQYVQAMNPQNFSYHYDSTSAVVTDGTVKADPGDGFAVFITDIVFSIGAATASSIFLEEGTTKILGPYYLEAIAGRGASIHFNTPKRCTASTAILVTTTGSISQAVDITGFVAAV